MVSRATLPSWILKTSSSGSKFQVNSFKPCALKMSNGSRASFKVLSKCQFSSIMCRRAHLFSASRTWTAAVSRQDQLKVGVRVGAITIAVICSKSNRFSLSLSEILRPASFHSSFCDESSARIEDSDSVLKIGGEKTVNQRMNRFWRRIKLFFRLLQWACLFLPVLVTYPVYFVLPESVSDGQWWRSLLVYCMQIGGPMFIKLGQWASTRADLFSAKLRSSFSKLQATCPPEPTDLTMKTIKEEFEVENIEDIFDHFELGPIGAGVVAQVHRAVLRTTKQEVAVKIRRYHIAEELVRDLELLQSLVHIMTVVLPLQFQPYAVEEAVNQFSTFMLKQLDLKVEASNLDRFAENFGQDNYSMPVKFPRSILTSKNGGILVETYEAGVPLSELLELERRQIPNVLDNECFRKDLANLGVRAFLQMVLVDNYCHSDLHPGNILVCFNVDSTVKDFANVNIKLNGITIVDVGLTTELSQKDQRNFIDLFTAVAKGNGKRAGELIIERAPSQYNHEITKQNRQKFIKGMAAIVSSVDKDSFKLERIHVGRVLQDVLSLVYQYKVPLDPNFGTLVLSIIIAEGILRQLDGQLDIFKLSVPFLLRADKSYRDVALNNLFRK